MDKIGSKIGFTLAGVAFITLTAQLAFELPGTDVPITGQTFGVLLVAVILGPLWGSVSVGLYVLLGILGLPVYAGGANGWDVIAGPTGGFLLAFVIGAWAVGWTSNRGDTRQFPFPMLLWGLGHGIILVLGFTWIAWQRGNLEFAQSLFEKLAPGSLMKTLVGGFITQVVALKWRLPLFRQKA
ncbi:MAG: biotin transporter BioY [Salibacteraceae bacterium]